MDIRRKTTYVYRNAEGRHVRGLASFFQTNQKSANLDPESGMRIVGPMLRLTACAELKVDEDDFDAVYPDSSLSFGPTVCSIGLKYNDHNYALPSGLTCPSMAPHLMDMGMPKFDASGNRPAESVSPSASDQENMYAAKRIEEALHSGEFTYRTQPLSSSTIDSDFNTWTSKASDVGEFSGREPFPGSRFTRTAGAYERMEMRSDSEMKVIEVPEEMAVSPSQLSDLDSDMSETEAPSKQVQYQITVIDGNMITGSVLPNIRCLCNSFQYKAQLISCPHCGFYQHVGCMGNFYNIPLPHLREGYTCNLCRDLTYNSTALDGAQAADQSYSLQGDAYKVTHNQFSASGPSIAATTTTTLAQSVEPQSVIDRTAVDLLKRTDQNSSVPSSSSSITAVVHRSGDKPWVSSFKDLDTANHSPSSEWEQLNEVSRICKRPGGDTNVNLRMPSPPRASKRKQDLTSTSYNDTEVPATGVSVDRNVIPLASTEVSSSTDEYSCSSSVNQTPISTPSNTPHKTLPQPLTPRTPMSTPGKYPLTPGSENSSSGLDNSPNSSLRIGERRRHKRLTPGSHGKLQLGTHANPFGSAWFKDYKEATNNEYSKALVELVNGRIGTSLERNHRIPPSCLTRSSLCRVVFFDHDEKGLEASIRLGANEVVTEVRGKFLLMEEYEHYVDPTYEYRRYVIFYHGLGGRVVVIDTSQYGNNARFIRRSCIPNCQLEHYLVQGRLQMVIRTSTEVMPGAELTLPFDLDYRACRYPLNCACARSRCPVVKWGRKLTRNKVVPRLDYQKYIESQLRFLSETVSPENSPHRSSPYETSALSASPLVRTPFGVGTTSPSSQPSVGYGANLASPLSSPLHFNPVVPHKQTSLHLPTSRQSDINTTKALNLETSPVKMAYADSLSPDETQSEVNSCSSIVTHGTNVSAQNQNPSDGEQVRKRFEPVITTRRQAAVMRSAVR